MANMRPLEGVKIVELSTYVAASSCGRMLADFGADVIKVEAPSGDGFRNFPRAYKSPCTEDCNPLFDTLNAGKKSLVLNLKTEEGMKIFHRMLAEADVFMTNTRNQSLVPMGLDYETLRVKYPRLVIANLVAYGEKGDEVNRPGYDTMALWTRGCFTHDISVDNEGHYCPTIPMMGAGDIACAMGLMGAIVSALYAREKTGQGDRVSISLYGTALWLGSIIAEYKGVSFIKTGFVKLRLPKENFLKDAGLWKHETNKQTNKQTCYKQTNLLFRKTEHPCGF